MSNEIETNRESTFKIWKNGYYEGDPLQPLHRSTYRQYGFISVLHATYLRCIKPYIKPTTKALELGPGRGAWTKCMLDAEEVWALDAMSAEYNRFYEYLDHPSHVRYLQVDDFGCAALPSNFFDFMFSFGCLCHVSFAGITAYAENLFDKMQGGSDCFWMVADFDKYNALVDDEARYNVIEPLLPNPKTYPGLHAKLRQVYGNKAPARRPPNDGSVAAPGTWYHAGIDRTCAMLRSRGYTIVDEDVGTCLRDPVIYFRKD